MCLLLLQLHNLLVSKVASMKEKAQRVLWFVDEHVERNWLSFRSPCNKRSKCWSVRVLRCCKIFLSYILKKKSLYSTYSNILVINIFSQRKILCLLCIQRICRMYRITRIHTIGQYIRYYKSSLNVKYYQCKKDCLFEDLLSATNNKYKRSLVL
jgi:hypothetical protein